MPSFAVSFEVFCGKCGAGLCNQSNGGTTLRRGTPYVDVEPCETCLDRAMAAARARGYAEGFAEAEARLFRG